MPGRNRRAHVRAWARKLIEAVFACRHDEGLAEAAQRTLARCPYREAFARRLKSMGNFDALSLALRTKPRAFLRMVEAGADPGLLPGGRGECLVELAYRSNHPDALEVFEALLARGDFSPEGHIIGQAAYGFDLTALLVKTCSDAGAARFLLGLFRSPEFSGQVAWRQGELRRMPCLEYARRFCRTAEVVADLQAQARWSAARAAWAGAVARRQAAAAAKTEAVF